MCHLIWSKCFISIDMVLFEFCQFSLVLDVRSCRVPVFFTFLMHCIKVNPSAGHQYLLLSVVECQKFVWLRHVTHHDTLFMVILVTFRVEGEEIGREKSGTVTECSISTLV